MALGSERLHVVGIGGTLRASSTSAWALERALNAAGRAGATTDLLTLNEFRLPIYEPGKALDEYEPIVGEFISRVRRADAMVWSTAAYQGTLAGVTKNAIDFFQFLSDSEPPFLQNRVVGLAATAGGDIAAVNAINAMLHSVTSLRGTPAPLFVAIPQAHNVFDKRGNILDKKWADRLDQLGWLVVDHASRFHPARIELALGA